MSSTWEHSLKACCSLNNQDYVRALSGPAVVNRAFGMSRCLGPAGFHPLRLRAPLTDAQQYVPTGGLYIYVAEVKCRLDAAGSASPSFHADRAHTLGTGYTWNESE